MIKWKRAGLAILCTAMMLPGCQPTTDAAIVTPKSAISGAKMLDESASKSVQEQVQAPESCTLDFMNDDGTVQVIVDAEVTVPEADGIRLKKAETRVFKQSDMDNLQENLLQGNPIWQRIYTEEQRTEGRLWTKDEFGLVTDKYIKNRTALEALGEKNGWELGTWQNMFTWLCSLREAAPMSFETKNVDTKLGYDKKAAENFFLGEGFEENSNIIWGSVILEKTGYNFVLNNNWSSMFKCAGVYLVKGNYKEFGGLDLYTSNQVYYRDSYAAEEEKTEQKLQTPITELAAKGDALVEALGLEEMELAVWKTCEMYDGYSPIPMSAVNLIYTPVYDGIPVTYTDYRYLSDYEAQNYSENFEVAYDDKGLAQMVWENPAQVYDMSDEYVFLLPFTDILHTFQEEAADVHQNDAVDQEQSMRKVIRITSIRLGYMWVPDVSAEMSGILIPVWDFMGNYISHWQGNEEQGIESSWGANDSPYQSFLTVNAMDGTVVKGYERPY